MGSNKSIKQNRRLPGNIWAVRINIDFWKFKTFRLPGEICDNSKLKKYQAWRCSPVSSVPGMLENGFCTQDHSGMDSGLPGIYKII